MAGMKVDFNFNFNCFPLSLASSLCFSVKQSIPVTVAADEVGELQYLPIWREFWLDPEREQHRKSYVEESFLESYFVAIRCPDNAQECAGLAKE